MRKVTKNCEWLEQKIFINVVSKFYQRISSKDYISNVVYKISIKMKILKNSKDDWIVDILVSILKYDERIYEFKKL